MVTTSEYEVGGIAMSEIAETTRLFSSRAHAALMCFTMSAVSGVVALAGLLSTVVCLYTGEIGISDLPMFVVQWVYAALGFMGLVVSGFMIAPDDMAEYTDDSERFYVGE